MQGVLLGLHSVVGGFSQSKFPGPELERTIRICLRGVAATKLGSLGSRAWVKACVASASVIPAVSYGLQMKIGVTLHTVTAVKPAIACAPAENLLCPAGFKKVTGKIVAIVTGVTVTATNLVATSRCS